jgi:hypothetical protein
MDYQSDSSTKTGETGRANRGSRAHNGSGLSGVKRQAVSETAQKSQQGTGNGTMTNIAEEQTITVTYNFNF